jgi:hypothetical protein
MSIKDPWCSLWHFLPLLHKMLESTCDENNYMHIPYPCSIFFIDKSPCVDRKQNPHISWCCHSQPNACGIISLILHNLKICSFWCNWSQREKLLRSTFHWSIPPSSSWGIWMSTQIGWYVFTWLCQCHLELQRTRKPFLKNSWWIFFVKKFNYVAKMQTSSILSLVVMVGLIASWLPPLQDTSPIAPIDLLQVVNCLNGEILTFSLC